MWGTCFYTSTLWKRRYSRTNKNKIIGDWCWCLITPNDMIFLIYTYILIILLLILSSIGNNCFHLYPWDHSLSNQCETLVVFLIIQMIRKFKQPILHNGRVGLKFLLGWDWSRVEYIYIYFSWPTLTWIIYI